MLFWEEPVVSAFVRVGTTVAGGEIDHVHGVYEHGCIHLIYSCRWFFSAPVYSIMGLPEELYFALIDVGYTARRCKVPGPLSQTIIDIARDCLETWREDERTITRFAVMVLSGPTALKRMRAAVRTNNQLPEPLAEAYWRLIRLLEYLETDG